MRTRYSVRNLKFAFLLAPLLGCGHDGTGPVAVGQASGSLDLPGCKDNQLLGTDGQGAFKCNDAPASAALPLPAAGCGAKQALNSSDGKTMVCVDLGQGGVDPGIQSRIDKYTKDVKDLTDRVNSVGNTGGASIWVGNTDSDKVAVKFVTNGKIERKDSETGLNAANDLCNDAFKGSHFCSMPELYNTVVAGKLSKTSSIGRAWAFFPSWNTPAGAGEGELQGTSDTCGSYTYPTADKKWKGIQVEWTKLDETGEAGFKFWGGSEAGCGSGGADLKRPLACCRNGG